MSDAPPPPQPLPDVDSQGFWKSLVRGELALQRCTACGRWQFPPLERCRICAGELALEPVSGAGTIHSYIVEHHKVAPGFDAELPYVIALVALDEAPHARVPGRILGAAPDAVRVGARVQVEALPLAGGSHRVAAFHLTSAPSTASDRPSADR